MEFSKTEIIHLLIAMILVAMVGFSMNGYRYISFHLFAMFALSYLAHEFAHKFIARYYCSWAEFRVTMGGLILVAMSTIPFMPFRFIAPGVVMASIYDYSRLGKIALVGPLTNILFCTIFYLFSNIDSGNFFIVVANFNSWIAVFNLIPFLGSDGENVFNWNRPVWALSIGLAIMIFIFMNT